MVKLFCSRICSLIANTTLLAPLMGGYLPALSYIINSRGTSNTAAQAIYKNIKFKFRRYDLSAVREILHTGEYDFLEDVIKSTKEPYIYDIGAHIGLFAIWSLAQNPNATISSIEASPETYKIISHNSDINSNFNWSTQNRAAWKNNDNIKFSNSLESSMSHRVDDNGEIEVKGITFSDLIKNLPPNQKINLIKIDIEGAEEAFLCADGVNFDILENLVIELHPKLCNIDNVTKVLEQNFPNITDLHDESLSKPLLYCTK